MKIIFFKIILGILNKLCYNAIRERKNTSFVILQNVILQKKMR